VPYKDLAVATQSRKPVLLDTHNFTLL
jgi:hypothetical protein